MASPIGLAVMKTNTGTWQNCREFQWMGETYRVWPDGAIERYDGSKLGWNLTGSSIVRSQAREKGLLPEGM
jgi:hypothetical protein